MEKKEPLFRISKRGAIPWWASLGIRLIGLLIALILCALIIFGITKLNPLKVYAAMWDGALGTNRRTWVTIRDTMMMLCIGLGLRPWSGSGVQDEILEHRCGGSGTGWRHCCCSLHALSAENDAKLAGSGDHVLCQCFSRRCLGIFPGFLQGNDQYE